MCDHVGMRCDGPPGDKSFTLRQRSASVTGENPLPHRASPMAEIPYRESIQGFWGSVLELQCWEHSYRYPRLTPHSCFTNLLRVSWGGKITVSVCQHWTVIVFKYFPVLSFQH